MGLDDKIADLHVDEDKDAQSGTVCLHSFCNLSRLSPVVFLYLLKECYFTGTSKATVKFRALQHQVHQVLYNDPQPGPATFVVQCLYVLPTFGEYCEGFSHLIISSIRRLLKLGTTPVDSLESKQLAAKLFLLVLDGVILHDERILIKLLQIFDVRMKNIANAICNTGAESSASLERAIQIVEQYIFKLIEAQSYMTAVVLLEQFSIRQSGKAFLLKMIETKQYKAAEKWAAYMGKPMLHLLVQDHIARNKPKIAYDIIRRNSLRGEYPELYDKYKGSTLKKQVEKGCWDAAEAHAKDDKGLIEYLVYLAMEAGYVEKVDELCGRYSLEGFLKAKEQEVGVLQTRYFELSELVLEDLVWVDEVNGLQNATSQIEECKVIGIDCEWKPNYQKGSKPNKVSIMQIASEKTVYVFDLIKLYEDVPRVLDKRLQRILHSPRILKLGYNFQCDIQQLAYSYDELDCFKHFEMLLDIQNVFKEPRGGLSGLAQVIVMQSPENFVPINVTILFTAITQKILGAGLNKTRRNCNWEERPLSRNQLEYAALDAAVLIHIFSHVRGYRQPTASSEGHKKIEWKSHIIYRMDGPNKKTVTK